MIKVTVGGGCRNILSLSKEALCDNQCAVVLTCVEKNLEGSVSKLVIDQRICFHTTFCSQWVVYEDLFHYRLVFNIASISNFPKTTLMSNVVICKSNCLSLNRRSTVGRHGYSCHGGVI